MITSDNMIQTDIWTAIRMMAHFGTWVEQYVPDWRSYHYQTGYITYHSAQILKIRINWTSRDYS